MERVACSTAGSGRLRHPRGGQERLREGRGCRWYLGTDHVATHDPPGGRDVELGQGTEGMPVLLVLPRGRCSHQSGTDSAAFPQGGGEQGGVCELL